jgi:hypothetical protein
VTVWKNYLSGALAVSAVSIGNIVLGHKHLLLIRMIDVAFTALNRLMVSGISHHHKPNGR